MSLYFKILLVSIAIPLLLSFDRRLKFWKKWHKLFPAIIIVAVVYILFDIWLTMKGVWGFNPLYTSEIRIFGLPPEEMMFFIIIPYASMFLHYAIIEYYPDLKLSSKWNRGITFFLILISLITAIANQDKLYTFYIFSTLFIVLCVTFFDNKLLTARFYITFLVILVPFLIVNGILTGTGISDEVVWYNDSENLGIRLFTIPVEDFSYAFSLILLNLLLTEHL